MAFTINGASRLGRTLRRAGVEMKELKPVNKEAADIALPVARRLAPVRTGALRDTLRTGATNRAGVLRAGNNRKTGVPYAPPIHWGWPSRGIKPNPFMLAAAQGTEQEWTQVYEKFADRVLNKVKGI